MATLATPVSVAKRFLPFLREYLQELKDIGQLVEVKREVNWKYALALAIPNRPKSRRCSKPGASITLMLISLEVSKTSAARGSTISGSRVLPDVSLVQ